MTNTPNARLARVLRLLADVAERGLGACREGEADSLRLAVREATWDAHCAVDHDQSRKANYLAFAESYATEAARLAGVPRDGWRTKPGHDCFEREVLVQHRNGKRFVATWTGAEWADESLSWRESAIAAWRPLPEPYRPEEKTDEQR